MPFTPGVGLMGRVWQAGEPLWSIGTLNDPRVQRSDLSRRSGIKGAFVFPVASEGRTIGVIACSTRRSREPDERLLRAVQVIGSQIGQFLARQEQQRHIARLNRIYAVLSGINATIVRVRGPGELFREACRISVRAPGFPPARLALLDEKPPTLNP